MKIVFSLLWIGLIHYSCGKRTTPASGAGESAVVKKERVKVIKTPVPKIIVVNDQAASKTFDGRLYYDLDGRRYWRNNKDGKYYLYNKSMNTNPDFKKP